MRIKKEQLLIALQTVKPGLAKREIVEQATHFVFTGEELCTFNDHICIVRQFKTDFVCSIPAAEFYKILDKIKAEEFDINLKDNKIVINAGKTRAGISVQDGQGLLNRIDILINKKKKWQLIPDDFVDALGLCIFSASRDMRDPKLTGLFVDRDAIISSDNLRLSQYILKDDIGVSFLIPATTVAELLNFDIKRFCVIDGWAFFETQDKTLFCAQLLVGMDYPAIDEYFQFDGVKFTLPTELSTAVDTALTMAEGETEAERLIEIEIIDGKIRCRGENVIAWIEQEFDIQTKIDQEIHFSINPLFLLKILAHTHKVKYNNNRLLFTTDNFYHLVAVKGE